MVRSIPAIQISGTLAFNTAAIFDLMAGNYYVNVHTAAHGSGEIRGQVGGLIPASDYIANLTGDEEVPPKTTDAVGLAALALNLETDQLYYTVRVSDVVSVTAAHIHVAPAGQNGPVVFGFYPRPGGGPFDAANPIGGSLQLDGRALLNLLTGYYYVNIHTVINPGGEIRGQVMKMPIILLPIILPDRLANGRQYLSQRRLELPWLRYKELSIMSLDERTPSARAFAFYAQPYGQALIIVRQSKALDRVSCYRLSVNTRFTKLTLPSAHGRIVTIELIQLIQIFIILLLVDRQITTVLDLRTISFLDTTAVFVLLAKPVVHRSRAWVFFIG